jgi:hypothetical protein
MEPLDPVWTSLGVDFPIAGASIESNFEQLLTLNYPTKEYQDTRGIFDAMIGAFQAAGWTQKEFDEYGPASFAAVYIKEKRAIRMGADFKMKDGKGNTRLSLSDATIGYFPEQKAP